MTQKYEVKRQVLFDRTYHAGETYEGQAAEVAHLVANGVLKPMASKSEAAPGNKAAPKLQNKAG